MISTVFKRTYGSCAVQISKLFQQLFQVIHFFKIIMVQSAGETEYTDCISVEE